MQCSFGLQLVRDTTIAALKWLGRREHTFIVWNSETESYDYTPFGKAVLASGLPPEVCMTIKVGACFGRVSEFFDALPAWCFASLVSGEPGVTMALLLL